MKTAGSLVVLLLVAAAAQAQEGPSFDCRRAGTATERAICSSPRLARLERRLVTSYETLAERIGRRPARGLADEQLALRQGCQGEPACIEARLIASTALFEADGASPPTDVALAPPLEVARSAPTEVVAVPRPEERPPAAALAAAALAAAAPAPAPLAAAPTDALSAEIPDAALAASPPDGLPGGLDAFPEVRRVGEGAAEPIAGPAPAEVSLVTEAAPESPVAAPPPIPRETSSSALANTFAGLPTYRRANVQGRLAEAGYGPVEPGGAWDGATSAALAAVLRDAAASGQSFDPSTDAGATALLDFIDSDRFKRDFLGEEVAFEPDW